MKRTYKYFDGPFCICLRCLWLIILLSSLVSRLNSTPVAHAAPLRVVHQAPPQQAQVPRFEAADCSYQDYEIPSDERIDCGILIVPEGRGQINGNTIRLAVAIIRTHSPTPAPDPILFLQGGPGYGALDMVDYFVAEASGLRAERDIILLDQRGTGYSLPDLRCVEFNELYSALSMQNPTLEGQLALEVQAAEQCRDRLLGEGINLAAYNSAANAADVNDLRIALGYSTLNLYGFSYGSRLALTVMRDFPEVVRSAVLDSALPLQANWWEEQPANVARAYSTLFAGCANDPACQAAYPELESHFYALVDRYNETPLVVEIPDNATGAPVPQLFSGDDMVAGGFDALYDSTLIAYLPLAIEQIYVGNTDVIAGLAGQLAGDASVSLSAMWFSVECQDEAPFNDRGTIVANAEVHPRFRNFVLGDPTPAVCEIWGVEPSPSVETEAVQSDIPALVLAGAYDPIHPPAWSELAASTLSQSFYFELAGASHGVGFDGCGQELVVSFVHHPTVAPAASCVAQQKVPPFVTNLYLNRGIYPFASLLLNFDLARAFPLLACFALLLSALLILPIAALAQRQSRQHTHAPTLVRWTEGLTFVVALLNVVFGVGLLLLIINTGMEQPYLLLFGLPSDAAPLFLVPWIGAPLGITLLILSIFAWRKHSGSVVGWVYTTLVAIAAVTFFVVLGVWRLLGLQVG